MKKTRMFFVFTFLSILFLNFVSAYVYPQYYYSSRNVIDNIITAGAPVLELLFGDYTGSTGEFSSGEMLFLKFLLFFMMFVIIQAVLKKIDMFKDNKAVIGILSVAIPLIAVRFMSANQLVYMILPAYGTLGIALTVILPFLIFFFFIHNTNLRGLGRRICWLFFITAFIVIWLNRADEVGTLGNQIYGWTIFVMALVAIFDKRLHSYLSLYELNKFFHHTDTSHIAGLKAEYRALKNTPDYATDKDIMKRLYEIEKELRTYKRFGP